MHVQQPQIIKNPILRKAFASLMWELRVLPSPLVVILDARESEVSAREQFVWFIFYSLAKLKKDWDNASKKEQSVI